MLIRRAYQYLIDIGILWFINDISYTKYQYKKVFGEKLNLDAPQTFNEKIQWLKIFDRKEIYTTMVDKNLAKEYVSSIIGRKYIIPTLGIWDNYDDIDFDNLPSQFVLKCTHDSGGLLICKDKTRLCSFKTGVRFKLIMKRNFYYRNREWPYKNIKPKIMAEKYMGNNLNDYKIFCFNGDPKYILVCSNRTKYSKNTDFFDINWNLQEFTRANSVNNPDGIKKPIHLNEMLSIARKLSKDTFFLRVDLYEVDNKVFFGELTFYPSGGLEGFNPAYWDKKLGNLIDIKR